MEVISFVALAAGLIIGLGAIGACVGIGITLGSHISPLARSHIEKSDVVFVAVSDGIVELWLKEMNPDVRSLQPLYAEGKSRPQTALARECIERLPSRVEEQVRGDPARAPLERVAADPVPGAGEQELPQLLAVARVEDHLLGDPLQPW